HSFHSFVFPLALFFILLVSYLSLLSSCDSPQKIYVYVTGDEKMNKEMAPRRLTMMTMTIIMMMVTMDKTCICAEEISRGSFPKGFVFGTASSAFQVNQP
uniref:Thioglucosidase n=1 Tax=Brassica oleracea var. oleracea TaxID=109376 RepID=A0A0D3BI07_BRAOL